MLPCALLLAAFFQIHTGPTNSVVGIWNNQSQDQSTIGVTEIVINTNESGHLQAHVWGKCDPVDCDWGVVEVNSRNGLAGSVFDAGTIKTTVEFIPLQDGRLLVVYKSEYKLQSDYPDQDHVEFFVREKQAEQGPESVAAKALLKKVAETYRSLASARFESEQTLEDIGPQTSTRQLNIATTVISQPGKYRVETTGSDEPRVLISNGETVWTYFPESNEYDLAAAGKMKRFSPLGNYTVLDQTREPARITGLGRVAGSNCTMLTLGRGGNRTRTIWIDLSTNFIRKDEIKDISSTISGIVSQTRVTTFLVARTVDSLDPNIFSFDPTRVRARERRKLQQGAPATWIGKLAPDFTLHSLDGQEVRLSELRGRVVILDYWATWCPSCRSAMPGLELLYRQLKGEGLLVLGIDDENSEEQRAFLEEFGYSFSSLVDPASKVKNLYNARGIPTTIIIDKEGKIRSYEVGEATYESLWKGLQAIGISAEGIGKKVAD